MTFGIQIKTSEQIHRLRDLAPALPDCTAPRHAATAAPCGGGANGGGGGGGGGGCGGCGGGGGGGGGVGGGDGELQRAVIALTIPTEAPPVRLQMLDRLHRQAC